MKLNFFKFYHQKFQNPETRPIVIFCTILYILSPIDLIPLFVPFFGIVDDLLLFVMFSVEMFIWLTSRKKIKKQTETETETKSEIIDAKVVNPKN